MINELRWKNMKPNKQNKSSVSISLSFNDLDSVRLRICLSDFICVRIEERKALRVFPAETRLTVYRRPLVRYLRVEQFMRVNYFNIHMKRRCCFPRSSTNMMEYGGLEMARENLCAEIYCDLYNSKCGAKHSARGSEISEKVQFRKLADICVS